MPGLWDAHCVHSRPAVSHAPLMSLSSGFHPLDDLISAVKQYLDDPPEPNADTVPARYAGPRTLT